jgi:hypothetical protein
MSDAETVRNAIGDDAEAKEALERILGRRDAYVQQVQASGTRHDASGTCCGRPLVGTRVSRTRASHPNRRLKSCAGSIPAASHFPRYWPGFRGERFTTLRIPL